MDIDAKIPVATLTGAILALLALGGLPHPLHAQDQEPDRVEEAKLARSGAGIRVSYWNLNDLPEVQNGSEGRWPLLEGYFQRGVDRHIAIESTVGVWRRQAETEGGGGVLGSGTGSAVTTWIVPLLTAINFYPFTGPEAGTEPYISAGAGFALGIEDAESGGTFTGGGTNAATGFALKGETGAKLRLSEAFGLSFFAGYQWARFGNDIGNTRTYSGFNFGGGLTYRFQY
jgi:hypothetical protein